MAGKSIRLAMSKQSREHLHAAARVASHLPQNPMGAVSSARQEMAAAFVNVLVPLAEREGRVLIEKLKNKIAGKR